MKKSHYVPKFILKKFSDKLCTYNVKTGVLEEKVQLEKAYMQLGFYSDEIEEKLNLRLENDFAMLLTRKILQPIDKIELSRSELRLVKKFLLVSVIRSMGSENFMQSEKQYYNNLVAELINAGCSQRDAKKVIPFEEKEVPNETSFDYWMRTIDTILDSDGSPQSILEQPQKTYPAYRWATVINAGYLAFWDSEYRRDEFVLTDIGMTSENELGWNGITVHNSKKLEHLIHLYKSISDDVFRKEVGMQITFVQAFHENFQMFPISAKRMIVEISPFFKFRYNYKDVLPMPKLGDLTVLNNEILFLPNDCQYVYPREDVLVKPHDNDCYVYDVKQLTRQETRYCNALFMDRINTTLGFSSLNKAVGSIVTYKRLTDYPNIARVNYKPLYEIINKRYQGGLKT